MNSETSTPERKATSMPTARPTVVERATFQASSMSCG